MLYDGALQGLHKSVYGFTLQNPIKRNEEIHNGLMRSHYILRELQQSLDLEQGDEFGDRMYALYGFWLDKIFEANVKKERGALPEVTQMLKDLRDSWEEMLRTSPDAKI
jgi:flagellar protein FliS